MGLLYRIGRACVISGVLVAGSGTVCWYADLLSNPWCSSFRIVRFGRATNAAFSVALDYKWSLLHLQWNTPEYNRTMAQIHLRSALLLRDMCSRNGGLFIKVGQHVGALEYLFPPEYVQTFKLFHSEAPQTSLDSIVSVIEEELGQPVGEVFCDLHPEPLGAASLAQVHRATLLKDRSQVAVKVQHPYVRDNSYTDIDTIDFLVSCIHWLFPTFRFQWLVDELRHNLPIELNFCYEAHNQVKFAAMFKHLKFVRSPKVHWDLTTSRLLTMEFCEGAKVTDKAYLLQKKINPNEVSQKLGELYSEMIFQRGFVHCDPHPGNIMVHARPVGKSRKGRREVDIIMLDHGLYTELTDEFRLNYCRLWQALIDRDQESLRHYCCKLKAGPLYRLLACMVTARAWSNIESGVTKSARSSAEMEAIQQKVPDYLPEITQLLDQVPRQLVLILKTNDLLRGIEHSLDTPPHQQSYLTMSRSCILALGTHQVAMASSWPQALYCKLRMKLKILIILTFELWLRLQAAIQPA